MWTDNFGLTGVTVELGKLIDAGFNIWDFEYPYFDESRRGEFEQKVIDHYRFREIGQETPARWLHYFQTRIREIMPYYNQLYRLEADFAKIEDPFESYNLTETFDKNTSGKGKVTGSSAESGSELSRGSTSRNVDQTANRNDLESTTDTVNVENTTDETQLHSDTPQGTTQNLFDGYLTDASNTKKDDNSKTTRKASVTTKSDTTDKITETNTTDSETSTSSQASNETNTEDEGTESYTLTRRGNIGVQPLGQEMQALRNALINIDMLIIEELNDLFLMVY